MMSKPVDGNWDLTSEVDVESFLRHLKDQEEPWVQCPARNPEGLQCEKRLLDGGRFHEDRHVAWATDTRVEWEEPVVIPTVTKIFARMAGYTGDQCEVCHGSRMVRIGTCLRCDDCFSTTGCS